MTVLRIIYMNSPDQGVDETKEWQNFIFNGTSSSGHTAYWGRQVEDPNKVWIVSEWPSVEDHCEFPGFATAEDAIKAALPSVQVLAIYHLPSLQPASLEALDAPMTWISTAFFSQDHKGPTKASQSAGPIQEIADAERRAKFEAIVREFSRQCDICGDAGRPRGIASGWTLEDDVEFTRTVAVASEEQQEMQAPQAKGKAFVSFLGWDSVDAHHAFSKTDVVKQNGPKMAQAGAEGWLNAHVAFRKVSP